MSVKQILHQILNFIRFEVLEMLTTLLQWRLCPNVFLMPTAVVSPWTPDPKLTFKLNSCLLQTLMSR